MQLETTKGTAYHQKTDIFKQILWYSFSPDSSENLTPVSVDRVKQIIEINRQGEKVDHLAQSSDITGQSYDFENDVGQDRLDRFDQKKKTRKSGNKKRRHNKKKRKSNGKKQ